MTLDRRRFLQLTAAGMVASVTNSACGRDTGEDARALAEPPLLEMLGPERAREIGTRYRAVVPKESTEAALRAAISRSQYNTFPWIRRRLLDEQIRDDFAVGRVVVINGWVLSEIEARLCALYSLSV